MESRRALLAKIHIAKKDLALDDDVYRTILGELYGVDSASKLAIKQLGRLVNHMQALGWKMKQKNRPAPEKARLIKKIWAQCYSLSRPVPAYADGIALQMFGVEKLIWCDHEQLRAITTALARQQDREGAETQ